MFESSIAKKRLVGLIIIVLAIALFFSFNRFPKLDAVGTDLDAVSSPEVQCFQGFCIERDSGQSFLTSWWVFSITYLRLVTVGMTFAFLVAGLTEAFIVPKSSGRGFSSGGVFKRTVKGLAVGPIMNLCSACIVPISTAFQKKGVGIEGAIAMVQGSATMNIPALAMVFFVFTPVLGVSRLVLAVVGALLIGPLVVLAVRAGSGGVSEPDYDKPTYFVNDKSPWLPVISEAFREWGKVTIGYLIRMGPIMIVAGFASGLAMQWISPSTISEYLGNDLFGIAIAATFGVLINVPLLFEIPLVALLLLLGMGTAPAAALLFTAAAGGPVTFWGLSKIMPKVGLATFITSTWALGVIGGLGVLAIGNLIWDVGTGLREGSGIGGGQDYAQVSTARTMFSNVSEDAGIDFVHRINTSRRDKIGAGVVVLDFDDDGYEDIYMTNSEGPNAMYRNNGDGTFTDLARLAGIDDPEGIGNGGCAADYDNDGDQDLYVTNYGPSHLFNNLGDGTFKDVSIVAGFPHSSSSPRSTGCAWGDFDGDGFLDLVIARYVYDLGIATDMFDGDQEYNLVEQGSKTGLDPTNITQLSSGDIDLKENNEIPRLSEELAIDLAAGRLGLFRNIGEGKFEDVSGLLGDISGPVARTDEGGVGNIWGAGFQPAWIDFDNDGDLDLYVVNDMGEILQPNVLWRNDGVGVGRYWQFSDISVGSGADVAIDGMGLAVGDYNLDGYLDIYVTNIGDGVLLSNNGDGYSFVDKAIEVGVGMGKDGPQSRVTWGAMFFDHDNDGDEDLYVVSGYSVQRNLLLSNDGGGQFFDVSAGSGADDSGLGRGGVYLDYDKDGCLDIFVSNYGQSARLLRNVCDLGNNWLVVELIGVVSNRDGIGARVTVVSEGRTLFREISGGSSQMGQNMKSAHFGLSNSDSIESVSIRWPSGEIQMLSDVGVNQYITVIEP